MIRRVGLLWVEKEIIIIRVEEKRREELQRKFKTAETRQAACITGLYGSI
jgi:hypothetical protein